MHRIMKWATIALIGLAYTGNSTLANATQAPMSQVPQKQQRTNQQRGNTGVNREKYTQERLDAMAEAANLTESELEIVAAELKIYDEARVRTWLETRKIYQEMRRLGDKATEQDYKESLDKLNELGVKWQKASQNFIVTLSQKLGSKKAFLVYMSQRKYNAKAGRNLRQN